MESLGVGQWVTFETQDQPAFDQLRELFASDHSDDEAYCRAMYSLYPNWQTSNVEIHA